MEKELEELTPETTRHWNSPYKMGLSFGANIVLKRLEYFLHQKEIKSREQVITISEFELLRDSLLKELAELKIRDNNNIVEHNID